MASGDLYSLIDVQTYLGQQVLNVYHYKQVTTGTGPSGSTNLASLFNTHLLPDIIKVQSNGLTHNGLIIENLDNPSDFGTYPDSTTGLKAQDGLPPFVSASFRYNRASRLVRNGQKRIGGLTEDGMSSGVLTGSVLTDAHAIAADMDLILSDTVTGASYEPRILHKATVAGVGGATATTPRADYGVLSVEFIAVSTQNTRKFGRGA